MPISQEKLDLTYVYEGREVRLTGRLAKKTSKSGKISIVWEVCPVSVAKTQPTNTVYNKWVKPGDLSHIEGENLLIKPPAPLENTVI
jgi:hypothetical protein